MKRVFLILAVSLVFTMAFASLTGCNQSTPTKPNTPSTPTIKEPEIPTVKEKVFSWNGMTITLPDDFVEVDDHLYSSDKHDVAITCNKTEFTTTGVWKATMPLEEYADWMSVTVMLNAQLSYIPEIVTKDGLVYFYWSIPLGGKQFSYLTVAYKGDDAFWLFSFVCETRLYSNLFDLFIEWAKTVKV